MKAPPDPALRAAQQAALEGIDWARVLAELELFAVKRGASAATAKDVSHAVVVRLVEGATMWNPLTHPNLTHYLEGAVRRTLFNARTSARHRYEVPSDPFDDAPDPAPADLLEEKEEDERRAAALSRLEDALVHDADARAVLALVRDGIDKPADVAARLGLPVGRVYDARDRIGRHVKRIAREQAAAGEEDVAE